MKPDELPATVEELRALLIETREEAERFQREQDALKGRPDCRDERDRQDDRRRKDDAGKSQSCSHDRDGTHSDHCQREAGVGTFLGMFQIASMPHEMTVASMKRFAEHVMPVAKQFGETVDKVAAE